MEHTFVVHEGVHQGDPASGAAFSLALARPVHIFLEQNHGVLIARNADDMTHLGQPESIFAVCPALRALVYAYTRLQMNPSKEVVWSPRPLSPMAVQAAADNGVPIHTTTDPALQGVVAAGAAIGTPEFEEKHAADKANAIIASLDRIVTHVLRPVTAQTTSARRALSLHVLFQLIRLCFPSQFVHLLRTMPPRATHTHAARLDSAIRRTVLRVLNADIAALRLGVNPLRIAAQLALPPTFGGMGLHNTSDLADAAYLASVVDTAHTVHKLVGNLAHQPPDQPPPTATSIAAAAPEVHTHPDTTAVRGLDGAIASLRERLTGIDNAGVIMDGVTATTVIAPRGQAQDPLRGGTQHRLVLALHRCNFNMLVKLIMEDECQPDIEERKRTVAALRSSGREGGTILTSTIANPRHSLDDVALMCLFRMQLRLPFAKGRFTCQLCNKTSDAYGEHAFTCTSSTSAMVAILTSTHGCMTTFAVSWACRHSPTPSTMKLGPRPTSQDWTHPCDQTS